MILSLEFQLFFSRVSLQNENTISETREKLSENELTDDTFTQSISLTSTRKKRNKTFSSSFSNRDFRLKVDAITRSNYYKTDNLDIKRIKDIKKSKRFVNIVNNVYRVKQMLKTHIHMIRAFHALQSDESFDFDHVSESMNYKEALKFFYWSDWKVAMKLKIASHIKNDIWELVNKSRERTIITGRWVFKLKYEVDDQIFRFKARWIVHEYKQQKEINYNEIWIEIVKFFSFRILFAIAAERRLQIQQMNIVTVFLYELLNENVYVSQSIDFIENFELICHFLKTLYGFKQSSRVWYEVLHFYLKKLDFDTTEFDHNVFVSKDKKYYIAVYVNDLLLFDLDIKYINFIKIKLNKRFEMIDLDFAQHYLNIEMIRENDFILLRQTTYLKKILKRFDMNKCSFVSSSMKFELVNVLIFIKEGQQINDDILYWYDSIVESLMYAAINIRSDIMYTICLLSRFCFNFDSTHMIAFQRLFKYIQSTFRYGIEYAHGEKNFHEFIDADWAENVENCRSISEYVFFIVDEAVFWASKRQNLVVLSSCEFEYYALNEANKKVKWLRVLLFEFDHIDVASALIWANNQSVIALSKNFEFHKRTKHIDVKYHWIREIIEKKLIQVDYVSIVNMTVDELTKVLALKTHARFLILLQMIY